MAEIQCFATSKNKMNRTLKMMECIFNAEWHVEVTNTTTIIQKVFFAGAQRHSSVWIQSVCGYEVTFSAVPQDLESPSPQTHMCTANDTFLASYRGLKDIMKFTP
jgi:hypothetical protein